MNKYERRLKGINKAKKVLKVWRACAYDPMLFDVDDIIYQGLIKTRVPCSCPWCGNPRKHFGKITNQELRENITFLEQLYEFRIGE